MEAIVTLRGNGNGWFLTVKDRLTDWQGAACIMPLALKALPPAPVLE